MEWGLWSTLLGHCSISLMMSSHKVPLEMRRWKNEPSGLAMVFGKTSQSVVIFCPSSVRMTAVLVPLQHSVSLWGRDSLESSVVGLDLDAQCRKVSLYEQPQPLPWDWPFSSGDDVWESTCLGIIFLASHVNFLYLSESANVQYSCLGKVWYFWRDGESYELVCALGQEVARGYVVSFNLPRAGGGPLDLSFLSAWPAASGGRSCWIIFLWIYWDRSCTPCGQVSYVVLPLLRHGPSRPLWLHPSASLGTSLSPKARAFLFLARLLVFWHANMGKKHLAFLFFLLFFFIIFFSLCLHSPSFSGINSVPSHKCPLLAWVWTLFPPQSCQP